MIIGVFSDVHGNFGILEQGVEWLRAQGADQLVFLGDLFADGGWNRECLRLLSREGAHLLLGQNDTAGAELLDPDSRKDFFNMAQPRLRLGWNGEILCSHTTTDPSVILEGHGVWSTAYLDNIEKAAAQFHVESFFIFFFGHTHNAVIYEQRDPESQPITIPIQNNTRVILCPRHRYLINPGSISGIINPDEASPGGNNPKRIYPSVAVLDTEKKWLRFRYLAPIPARSVTRVVSGLGAQAEPEPGSKGSMVAGRKSQ